MPLKLHPPRAGKTPNFSIRGTYLGVAVDRSAGTPKRHIAQQQLKQLEDQIERGEYPPKPAVPVGATFLSAAVAYMKTGGDRKGLARLIQHFGETPISEIEQADIDAASLALFPTATPATRNRLVYTPASAVIRRAGRDFRLRRPPGAKGRQKTDFLRPEDAAAILNATEPSFRALLLVLLYTGCRVGEAMRMKWEYVDLQHRWAYIGETKNGDPRTTLLREDVTEALRALADGRSEGPVFPFRRGGGLKDKLVAAKLKACGVTRPPRKRGETKESRRIPPHRLKWVGFHTFRHTWATWMRRYGKADLQGLVATGNWRDPRSAARYAHVAAREEWGRVESLPSVAAGKSVE
jgi:integrase